jgi:hypothetical protein
MSANEGANRDGGTEATQKGGDYCPLCGKGQLKPLRVVEDVSYLRCNGCGSILAESSLLSSARFGHLLLSSAMESARCYVDAGMAAWAIGELQKAHRHATGTAQ